MAARAVKEKLFNDTIRGQELARGIISEREMYC